MSATIRTACRARRRPSRRTPRRTELTIVAEFYDAAVSGADEIQDRPGFADMLAKIEGNGARTVLVEDASRFARTVLAQELGVLVMKAPRRARGDRQAAEDLTETDDPARVMIRQVGASFAQYEKARLVQKLRAARERKRAAEGRCEGRKPVPAETVAAARKLEPIVAARLARMARPACARSRPGSRRGVSRRRAARRMDGIASVERGTDRLIQNIATDRWTPTRPAPPRWKVEATRPAVVKAQPEWRLARTAVEAQLRGRRAHVC